ncbi:hypothetical protein N7450_002345 [Penicillium hetheringtonii]|uniref:Uncharacterized protein n=1 Tax=Penicillium hetheringtonii TaxID=911720 RepID=A0AAD6GY30_9EURO|nr:hypothetical protein N7450_002345 [Penicillium hetheringtonii]
MSRIETELWLPNKYNYTATQDQSGGYLVMRFDNPETPTWADRIETLLRTWDPSTIPQTSFIVPLSLTATEIEGFQTKPKTFNIHSRDAKGIDMGEIPSVAAALPQLKKFLKIPNGDGLSLFRCTPDTLVRTDKNLAPLKHIGTPAVHGYTDQQPININSSILGPSRIRPPPNRKSTHGRPSLPGKYMDRERTRIRRRRMETILHPAKKPNFPFSSSSGADTFSRLSNIKMYNAKRRSSKRNL